MFALEELTVDERVASFTVRAIARIVDIMLASGLGIVSAFIAIVVLLPGAAGGRSLGQNDGRPGARPTSTHS